MCALVAVCASATGAPQGYFSEVSHALDALAAGDTNAGLASIRQAFEFNANDALAHTALGLTLLMGGRADDAAAEFTSAVETDPDCAEAIYGQGLTKLAKGQLGPAAADFCRAQAVSPNLDISGSIEYAKLLAGGSYTSEDATGDEAHRAMRALALMKQNRCTDAAAIWQALLPSVTRPGFGEPIGCSMTFLPKSPLALTGWVLKERYKPLSAALAKLQSVSGNVALRADLSHATDVKMVAFYVDGDVVGITNQRSFQYDWDTTRFANGLHTVKITGADSGGFTLSEKTTKVVVRNPANTARPKRVDSDEAVKLRARLWNLMRLKPSASAVNFNLARCALENGDRESAVAHLERVMAANPDYMDAADTIARLNKNLGAEYARVFKGDAQVKKMALTFDDGPKKETPGLLDVLKAKGVTATFFVVGKQAELYPDTLKRIKADGHEIENHTYGHRALGYLTQREIAQEYFKTAATVRSITGAGTTAVRPPGGRTGGNVDEFAKRFGITIAFWSANCVSLEGTRPERMAKYAIASARPGGILLMHNADAVTVAALPGIIDALRGKGYSLVSLSELIGKEGKK